MEAQSQAIATPAKTKATPRWVEAGAESKSPSKSTAKTSGRWVEGANSDKSTELPELAGVRDGIMRQRMNDLGAKGETINIVAVGESGLGKTTLLSNIFSKDLRAHSGNDSHLHPVMKTIGISQTEFKFVMDEVPFRVTMTDTPGFGDSLDLERSFKTVIKYLDFCNKNALQEETRVTRAGSTNYEDCLVDAVLFFFAPHRIKEVDLEILRRIDGKAPVIPVLAKSDAMTMEELTLFREEVVKTLAENNITVVHEPFAVVASMYPKKTSDGTVKVGREYPWGFVEVENEDYSDIGALRRCILTDGLSDLKRRKIELYEGYRSRTLLKRQNGLFKRVIGTLIRVAVVATIVPLALRMERGVMNRLASSGGKESDSTSQGQSERRSSRRRR
ncbi:hypothetical protein NDN08_001608 [Rhodosorus marinus]|uniref:Septin-type G domain-containing protein n=1 Tax=Rhodosorus marinus TaxID=101924 RepID=A0AAV8UU35_9RHOD|nr:hypothetical protein NDN08_001608 [Rhodosorus marinus]